MIPRRVHAFMGLFGQQTARTNAAKASARLRLRRAERDEVDSYLRDLQAEAAADTP